MCCGCSRAERREAARHVQEFSEVAADNTVALGAAVGLFGCAAFAADGYFVDHPRFVYEFWTLNGTTRSAGGAPVRVNDSFFATFDNPLPGVGLNGTAVEGWNGTALWANFTTQIPPGALANVSALLVSTGNAGVPAISMVWVGVLAVLAMAMQVFWRRRSRGEKVLTVTFIALLATAAALTVFLPDYDDLPPLPNGTDTFGLPLRVFYAGRATRGTFAGLWFLFAIASLNLARSVAGTSASRLHLRTAVNAGYLAELVASAVMVVQLPIAIAKVMEPDDTAGEWTWAGVLTPAWIMLVLNLVGWAVWIGVAQGDDFMMGSIGQLAMVSVSTILVEAGLTTTLVLLCKNDGVAYAQQSAWPVPWVTVVAPLAVVCAPLALCSLASPAFVLCERIRDWNAEQAVKRRRYAEETAGFYANAEDGLACTPPMAAAAAYKVLDGGDGHDSDRRTPLMSARDMQRVVASFRAQHLEPVMLPRSSMNLAKGIRKLRKTLEKHPFLVTAAHRAEVVRTYERFRQELPAIAAGVWSEEVAKEYGLMLWCFTASAGLLRRDPSLQAMRDQRIARQPPPPPSNARGEF